MLPPARRALTGMPASASPVAEVTLPLSGTASSAARGWEGSKKAEAAAKARIANAAPVRSWAFIVLTFLFGFQSRLMRFEGGFYAFLALPQRPKRPEGSKIRARQKVKQAVYGASATVT